MSKRLNSTILALAILAILAALPVFWQTYSAPANLEVYFFDVAQAESILVKTPAGQNILIDGGYDNKVIKRLSETLPEWDNKIDLMILTHPHDDHVTGLVEVLRRYEVDKVLTTGVLHSTPNYLEWLKEIKEQEIPILIMDKPRTLDLGDDCRLELFWPDTNIMGIELDNLNNSSIAMKLIYGKSSFFLGGDIEKETEKKLLQKGIDLNSDVMKASHHGSDTSSTDEFISAVDPEYAVITVGKNNPFNLPSQRVIKRLERKNIRILRTDLNGTIKFISDGETVEYID